MEKFDKEDSHESASDRSIHHPAAEGVDEIDLNVSPEHHAFGDEGKRSPSSNKGDDVGFPSFRIGEGRRSPSPVSLSNSEQGQIESSSPTLFSRSKSEQGEILSSSQGHEGSSSSSAHVENDFEQAVHEQKTHDMICPVCGNNVTKTIILKRKGTRPDDDEIWGCLGCLSLFIHCGEGPVKEPVVPGAAGELPGTEPSQWRPSTSEPELNKPPFNNWNCLPELLPPFSWGPIPVYDVQYPVDTDESPGVVSSAQENITDVEGHQDATGGSPTTSSTPETQPVVDPELEVHQVTEHVSSEATKESRLHEHLLQPGIERPAAEPGEDPSVDIPNEEPPAEADPIAQEYLKSIVHGGLDVTLVSLGVVASGAGGDAKTITVIAIGLANLVFGLITHLGTIMSLYYNNWPKFVEDIGQGFVQGCLSFISFLFFGALAPITYGFSFRNATNRDYKFASMCVVALVCIVLLGAAQAHVKSKSAVRVISLLIVTGFVAVTAGYETGNYVGQLLKYFEFDSV